MRFLSCFCLCVIGAFAGTATQALTFRPTVYDDGYACPGNCDAHVAFRSEYNGTKYAFDPASSRNDPKPCVKGMQCRICFDDTDTSCLTVLYRGGGPAKLRFDFTPAFYAASCGKPELPAQVVAQCNSYAAQRVKLATGKLYCVSDAKDPKCREVIARAEAAKTADTPLWDECRTLGQAAFNRKYARSPAKQRDNDCTYEHHGTGGPNRLGEHWQRLLPAACQPGSYVGRDGTDCCGPSDAALAGLGRECTPFLVSK